MVKLPITVQTVADRPGMADDDTVWGMAESAVSCVGNSIASRTYLQKKSSSTPLQSGSQTGETR